MIRKRRLPGTGERVKVGRRLITVPGVKSMTNPNPAAPVTKPADCESERPTDEPTGPARWRPTMEYDDAGAISPCSEGERTDKRK